MSEEPEGRVALLARAGMYGGVLVAGVALVLSGETTPTEASVFVSPFLMFLQKGGSASPARTAPVSRRRESS